MTQAPNGLWFPTTYQVDQDTSEYIASPVLTAPAVLPMPELVQGSSLKAKKPWTPRMLAGRPLWDWMSLLVGLFLIPVCVGIATVEVTNRQTDAQNALSQQLHGQDTLQHRSDQEIAQQARYDDLFQVYHESIDQLLLESRLRTFALGSDVQDIAHSRTLDILRQIDTTRKRLVISYLSDLKLVETGYFPPPPDNWRDLPPPVVSLAGADLRQTNLDSIWLDGANFGGANFNRASLSDDFLDRANFSGADLFSANLSESSLTHADFFLANLSGANLNNSNFQDASFHFVRFNQTDFTGADLGSAKHYPGSTRFGCYPFRYHYA